MLNTTYPNTDTEKKWNEMRFQEYRGDYYSYTRAEWIPIKKMDPKHVVNALHSIENRMEDLLAKLSTEGSPIYNTYANMPRPDLYRSVSNAYRMLEAEIQARKLVPDPVVTPPVETTAAVVALSETKVESSPTPIESVRFSESDNSQKRFINTFKSNGINTLEDLATFSLLDFATFWLITPEAAWFAKEALKSKGLGFAKPEDSKIFQAQIAWPANTKPNSQRATDEEFYTSNKVVVDSLSLPTHWNREDWIHEAHLLIERVKARLLAKTTILGKRIILRPFAYVAHNEKELRKLILKESGQRIKAMILEGDMNDRVLAYITRNIDDVVDAIMSNAR